MPTRRPTQPGALAGDPAEMPRVGDLALEQDLRFQRREWRAERIGWVVVLALVLAALAGMFGHGPVSWTSVRSGPLEVSYERFGRRGGSQAIVISADAAAARDGRWVIEIDRDYAASIGVTDIVPEPDSSELAPDAVRYTFVQADPAADLEVQLSLSPEVMWAVDGTVRLGGAAEVGIDQFFYP